MLCTPLFATIEDMPLAMSILWVFKVKKSLTLLNTFDELFFRLVLD